MDKRLWKLLLLLSISAIICGAQPPNTLTWLKIEVHRADDKLYTTSTINYSLILLPTEKTGTRVTDGRLMGNDPGTLIISELTPGTHELNLTLNEYGITDGPKTFEISKGANQLIWKLPPFYPVEGELLLDGKPKATTLNMQCQIMAQDGNGRPFLTTITDTPKGYHLAGLMTGKYNALIYCDQGYALTEFIIPADGKMEPLKPLSLLPGGRVVVHLIDKDDKPIPAIATLSMRRIMVPPRFTPRITVTTDLQGTGNTVLPPGEWRWTNALVGYTPAVGTVNVVGGVDTELKIKLIPLPA
ncbi:MAG: hypothetical protein WCJ56_03105 [bacterium]